VDYTEYLQYRRLTKLYELVDLASLDFTPLIDIVRRRTHTPHHTPHHHHHTPHCARPHSAMRTHRLVPHRQVRGNADATDVADAAGALRNFALQSRHNKVAMHDAGAIEPLVELLRKAGNGSGGAAREQRKIAVATLKVLSWHCDENKHAIAAAGGIPLLVALVRSDGAHSSAATPTPVVHSAHCGVCPVCVCCRYIAMMALKAAQEKMHILDKAINAPPPTTSSAA
jgi:hypothetical protein